MSEYNKNSDFSHIVTGAFSSLTGMVRDIKNDFELKVLKCLEKMDVAKKEELEVLQAILCEIRIEQENIKQQIKAIEKKLKK